jgi:Zn-finger nucleic acid-binding protein
MGVDEMKCPACKKTLTEATADSIVVDVCKHGCGGIWFDCHELRKVDNATESAGEALLEVEHDASISVDHEAKKNCPRCEDQPLIRHFASTQQKVAVDECYTCGGVWLDAGELGRIRAQYATEEERDGAFQGYFDTVFGEKLARLGDEKEDGLLKAQRFARMFRFLCPSYYIPGKQAWGSF